MINFNEDKNTGNITDEQCLRIIEELHDFSSGVDKYCYGLPNYDNYQQDMIDIIKNILKNN